MSTATVFLRPFYYKNKPFIGLYFKEDFNLTRYIESIDANLFTRWQYAQDDKKPWIELDFKSPKTFNRVICGEYKRAVEAFKIEALINGEWKILVTGEKIGNNFNASFETISAQKYRLTILKASKLPYIAELTFVKY